MATKEPIEKYVERLSPELLRGLIDAYGVKNVLALARKTGVSATALYLFLGGRTNSLSIASRRKLADFFCRDKHLFVVDIIGTNRL